MDNKIKNSARGLITYLPLLQELVNRDIKVRYRKSILGITWTILNPLLMMLVMVFIFSHFFKSSIQNYPVYILTGQLVFNFFSSSTNMGLDSIVVNSSLIKKVYIPKYLFPLSVTTSCLVNFGFSAISMIIVMVFTRSPFYPSLICLPLLIIYLYMFALGMALLLSAVNVYFRDITHLYQVLLTAWMYFTPVFWSVDLLAENTRNILLINPLYHLLRYFRLIVLENTFPSLIINVECLLIGVLSLLLGTIVFYKLQDGFILYV